MSIVIERVESATISLAAFLQAHHQDMEHTAPAESRHALHIDLLLAPGVRLFAAFDDHGQPVATGALARVEVGHEEVKSMRTDPAVRGQGYGRAMLDFLLTDAGARGIRRVSLETGSADFFTPARSLYASAGFRECGPFGGYRVDPHSTFMTCALPAASEVTPSHTG